VVRLEVMMIVVMVMAMMMMMLVTMTMMMLMSLKVMREMGRREQRNVERGWREEVKW
jgi:hypothetical protein